jgi:hypothetical protein
MIFSFTVSLALEQLAKMVRRRKMEGIAKLHLRTKFDGFFVGLVVRKARYPLAHGHVGKNPNERKKRGFGFEWSFALLSMV